MLFFSPLYKEPGLPGLFFIDMNELSVCQEVQPVGSKLYSLSDNFSAKRSCPPF